MLAYGARFIFPMSCRTLWLFTALRQFPILRVTPMLKVPVQVRFKVLDAPTGCELIDSGSNSCFSSATTDAQLIPLRNTLLPPQTRSASSTVSPLSQLSTIHPGCTPNPNARTESHFVLFRIFGMHCRLRCLCRLVEYVRHVGLPISDDDSDLGRWNRCADFARKLGPQRP